MNEKKSTIETARKVPHTETLNFFWKSLESGEFTPLTDEEISAFVDFKLSQGNFLTSLTPEEIDGVKRSFSNRLRQRADDFVLRDLVEDKFAHVDLSREPQDQTGETWQRKNKSHFLIKQDDIDNSEYSEFLEDKEVQPLEDEEKVKLLSNPEFWLNTYYLCGKDSRSLYFQGMRSLWEKAHGYDPQRFREQLESVRESTGHQIPLVLDLGGAAGLALYEAKKADSNITTVNITIDEEPAMLPVDKTIICPAEAVPKELEGKVDLLISRTAFRYFAYPDIALKNVIKMLATGGHADVSFSCKRSVIYRNEDEINTRLTDTFNWIRQLEKQEVIKTNLTDAEYDSINRNSSLPIKIDKI